MPPSVRAGALPRVPIDLPVTARAIRLIVVAKSHVDHVERSREEDGRDDPRLPDPRLTTGYVEGGHGDERDRENGAEDVVVNLHRTKSQQIQQKAVMGRLPKIVRTLFQRDHGWGRSEMLKTHEKTKKHEPKMAVDLLVYHTSFWYASSTAGSWYFGAKKLTVMG